MQVQEALRIGLDSADAEILLAFALGQQRTWALAHPEYALSEKEEATLQDYIQRRRAGEPVAYITGEKEFYGRSFIVNQSVLIPRPATEELIDVTLRILKGEKVPGVIDADTDIVIASPIKDISGIKYIIDIGTGSGCIAVTLALECPEKKIIATDISADALNVAKKNAERHKVLDKIIFREGDCLDPIADITEPFLIVSNPPYIPQDVKLMKDVQDFEPHSALFSGKEGIDIIQKLVKQSRENALCRGIIVECRKEQAKHLATEDQ